MTQLLKQSTSVVIPFGPFVDKTDGVTEETGLVSALDHASTGIKLSKNGGALTIRHASVTASTYDTYGNYLVTLDTTDTNTLGRLRVQFNETATCLPVWQDFMVVTANIYDSLVGGSDLLDVSVTQLAGVAQSLTDLKDFADDGYDPSTNKVQGVVLTDTVTTYTGNTPQTGDVFPLASTEIADIKAKTDNLPSDPADASVIAGLIDALPTANENADALLDRANGVETGFTLRQALRLVLSTLAGKISGAGTTNVVIRDVNDSKNRLSAIVDSDGNRTSVTKDVS
jgi:hypothetical protein